MSLVSSKFWTKVLTNTTLNIDNTYGFQEVTIITYKATVCNVLCNGYGNGVGSEPITLNEVTTTTFGTGATTSSIIDFLQIQVVGTCSIFCK